MAVNPCEIFLVSQKSVGWHLKSRRCQEVCCNGYESLSNIFSPTRVGGMVSRESEMSRGVLSWL